MPTKQPLVSIVIACKNNAPAAKASLDSVKAQTYPHIELIVVDNFSTDGTPAIVKSYTDKFYQLGPERSTQFNYGATKAQGEYLYRIGLEFVLEPDVVEKCVSKMAEGYDALAVHNRSKGDSIWAHVRYLERETYKNDDSIVGARFFKRSVFEDLGGFDESLVAGEDFDIHNRLVAAGYKWAHVDAVEYHIGEPKTIGEVWQKFHYYGRTLGKYNKKAGSRSVRQFNFFRPQFVQLQKDLVKQPKLFTAFWYYMFVKYLAGATGMLRGAPKELE